MSITVQNLIDNALLDLGQLAQGDSPNASETAQGLWKLNGLLTQFNADGLLMPGQSHDSFTLNAGVVSHTFGLGGLWATAYRPVRVVGVSFHTGNFYQGCRVMSFTEFREQTSSPTGRTDALPSLVAADNSSPIVMATWPPTNAACTVDIDYWYALTLYTAATDVVDLPPGYYYCLQKQLAAELMPSYGVKGDIATEVAGLAKAAMDTLKQLNADITTKPAPTPQR